MTCFPLSVKHLWDERPADWPSNIPFKDPNNACKEGMLQYFIRLEVVLIFVVIFYNCLLHLPLHSIQFNNRLIKLKGDKRRNCDYNLESIVRTSKHYRAPLFFYCSVLLCFSYSEEAGEG